MRIRLALMVRPPPQSIAVEVSQTAHLGRDTASRPVLRLRSRRWRLNRHLNQLRWAGGKGTHLQGSCSIDQARGSEQGEWPEQIKGSRENEPFWSAAFTYGLALCAFLPTGTMTRNPSRTATSSRSRWTPVINSGFVIFHVSFHQGMTFQRIIRTCGIAVCSMKQ